MLAWCSMFHSFQFDMQHDYFQEKMFDPGAEDVFRCVNICLQVTAFVIPFNLICNMTVLKK